MKPAARRPARLGAINLVLFQKQDMVAQLGGSQVTWHMKSWASTHHLLQMPNNKLWASSKLSWVAAIVSWGSGMNGSYFLWPCETLIWCFVTSCIGHTVSDPSRIFFCSTMMCLPGRENTWWLNSAMSLWGLICLPGQVRGVEETSSQFLPGHTGIF